MKDLMAELMAVTEDRGYIVIFMKKFDMRKKHRLPENRNTFRRISNSMKF